MINRKKIKKGPSVGTVLSVCLMIFCLTFLTSLNFFLYSADSDNEVISQNTSPTGPTEEKASSNFSIVEEILHESSFVLSSDVSDNLFKHHITDAEKLQIIHPELLLRPPRA